MKYVIPLVFIVIVLISVVAMGCSVENKMSSTTGFIGNLTSGEPNTGPVSTLDTKEGLMISGLIIYKDEFNTKQID